MTLADAATPAARPQGRAAGWVRPKTVFLAGVLVVLAVYTEMAFGLDWRTQAGRIGPGFFPRIVGVGGLLITLWALVTAIRTPEDDEVVALEDEVGDADLGKHPRLLAIMVLAAAALVATLLWLGTIISCALFLGVMLSLLNRGHHVTNAVVAICLPLVMYILLQTLLNAGLPEGILPRF
ncbi:tripartite tricarboxylate transporter TctB family protein [Nocardioides sp. zg-1228]|uniref:tripartite tricarboxylate transporter TctB family protein n=1 Tax=Nocardioides sp. zg-1228 TaxID=2763008 RepID=UPI0016429A0A|nr:tripartite tricarboxylate transporter TctB family protein [Nocardioides sp. zg-1228]MBC2931975.1 tripartite tricarboxylate transporter TctB family protein [Nocardioides sp. zg-1228]QSF57531.1 tripartite tricarboxylate transporter TctB family protein [Nocardioides sp. zg-1228]